MPSKRELIRNKAVELIKNNPSGLRYSELQRELAKCFPDIPPKNFPSSFWNLDITRDKEIYKPTRGLFKYRFPDESKIEEEIEKNTKNSLLKPCLKEEDFYEPFANYLKTDLGECTEAVASAEIKIDPSDL